VKTPRDDGSFSFSGVSWILKTHLEKEKPSQDVNGRLFIDKQKEATMKTHSHILINVPHASTFIPEEERRFFDEGKLTHELLAMTDHFCDDLFGLGYEMIRFPVSRLFCDFERFRDDEKEMMAQKGMGACYVACSDQTPLRQLTLEHREEILRTYYDTYHQALTLAVEEKVGQLGRCVIIDGHSFPAVPLPYEYDQNPNRPDICIGTDDFHTAEKMVRKTTDFFSKKGFCITINAPFAGTMVPMKYYKIDPRVSSIMIEINRKLYMKADGTPNEDYPDLKEFLGEWLALIEKC
jgi:N-formylglutamate amidohydrolase